MFWSFSSLSSACLSAVLGRLMTGGDHGTLIVSGEKA